MGRVIDALLWRDMRAPLPPAPAGVRAAAGRVELARHQPGGRLPLAVGGDNLLRVDVTGLGAGWWDRDAAISLPTVSRGRDLICGAIGALPFTLWSVDLTGGDGDGVGRRLPQPRWMTRPDPNRTRQWMLAWTADDLYFYGVAHWLIVDRYADTTGQYPRAFVRLDPGELQVGGDGRVTVNGDDVDPRDVVEFLSPIPGILSKGFRAVSIAVQLDDAAERFAGTEVPSGWLQEQDGGEDLSGDELAEQAAMFNAARRENTTAALNKYLTYTEAHYDPSTMQLVEARTYQALELSRLGNVPGYLVGAPAGTGMTYLNAEQAKADLIDFGALPLIGCIEQTLSGPNVVPAGQAVRLDVNAWLRNPFTTATSATPSPNDMQIVDPAATVPNTPEAL